ncbi:ABC transporter permease [Sphingomonas sp. GCM10030256]|uniref:ABC transporter permease n=1 Tax=Sphingomonas sp. GCM10030256 TaxID=3273427 RepID=UPI003616620C
MIRRWPIEPAGWCGSPTVGSQHEADGVRGAWRLAGRDLRGGLGSLVLLLVCLTIAVAGLAAVTSLSSSIRSTIDRNGRDLLGGDLSLSVAQRSATPEEQAAMARLGGLSPSTTLRSTLVAPTGSALVELSGIAPGWPPAGKVTLRHGGRMPGRGEAVVGRELAERFGLRPGATVRLGFASFRVTGIIQGMPAASGFALAPPVLVTPDGLATTRLVQPGSLYTSTYRILLPAGVDAQAAGQAFQRRFPSGGWRALDRGEAAAGTRRFVDRVGEMLLLIALGALGIGSIGIASSVAAFAASRRSTVAVLKIHGARRRDLGWMLALAIGALAALAIAIGLAIGAAAPALVAEVVGDLLPIQPDRAPQPAALLLSAVFGLLVTVAASWRPVARAVAERPAAILRGDVEGEGAGWHRYLLVPLVAGGLAVTLAAAASDNPRLTLIAIAGAVLLAGAFAALGWMIARIARGLGGRGGPIVRLGIGALHRPGSATVRLSVALGLGLSLLVALSGIGSSLSAEIGGNIPKRAPALFMLDIPAAEEARFRALAEQALPGAELRLVPSLRGPVTALNGRPVSAIGAVPEGAWILRGDRGLTFARDLPPANRLVAGEWWPANYSGSPLISLDVDAARALNLQVGDTMTVAVLGRPIEARIASLREIDWRSFGFNFAIIFAPGALDSAPYTLMATVAPGAGVATALFERRLSEELPMVSTIRVSEVVGRVSAILAAMDAAIRLASAVAILIGVAVLAGAVAATRAKRARESVLLKLVGASRAQVLQAQLIEFLAMSAAIAAAAFGFGTLGAWATVTQLFELPFRPDWPSLVALPVVGVAVAVATALFAALPALSARPAQALRSL